ncbi:MAG TPA: hypothetical protein VIN72_12210 [Lutibacter sp.]
MNRIIIYPSDIMKITGKSQSFARKEIQNLKKELKKEKHQKVTIMEYCCFYALDLKVILEILFSSKLKNVY